MNNDGEVIFIDLDDARLGSIYIDAGFPLIVQFVRYQENGRLDFNESNAKAFYKTYFKETNKINEAELFFQSSVFYQLMMMSWFGVKGIIPMWNILKYALDKNDFNENYHN